MVHIASASAERRFPYHNIRCIEQPDAYQAQRMHQSRDCLINLHTRISRPPGEYLPNVYKKINPFFLFPGRQRAFQVSEGTEAKLTPTTESPAEATKDGSSASAVAAEPTEPPEKAPAAGGDGGDGGDGSEATGDDAKGVAAGSKGGEGVSSPRPNERPGPRRHNNGHRHGHGHGGGRKEATGELSKTNIYISGLKQTTTDDDLKALCSEFGTIVSAKVRVKTFTDPLRN